MLTSGEREIRSLGANLVINSADYGLRPITGAWMRRPLLGVGDESLGGRLQLTTRRLVFVPHVANRVHVELDIPLQSILSLTDISRGIARMMRVEWRDGVAVLVIWGIRRLMLDIEAARNSPESL